MIIIQAKMILKPDDIKKVHDCLTKQAESGVILLTAGFDFVCETADEGIEVISLESGEHHGISL